MQNSKQIFEKQKREERAKDVTVVLSSSTTTGFNFDVKRNDEKERIKYIGSISKNNLDDSCTCQSFFHLPRKLPSLYESALY